MGTCGGWRERSQHVPLSLAPKRHPAMPSQPYSYCCTQWGGVCKRQEVIKLEAGGGGRLPKNGSQKLGWSVGTRGHALYSRPGVRTPPCTKRCSHSQGAACPPEGTYGHKNMHISAAQPARSLHLSRRGVDWRLVSVATYWVRPLSKLGAALKTVVHRLMKDVAF